MHFKLEFQKDGDIRKISKTKEQTSEKILTEIIDS